MRAKTKEKSSNGALAMAGTLDELVTTTICLRQSELRTLNIAALDNRTSNSKLIRSALKDNGVLPNDTVI